MVCEGGGDFVELISYVWMVGDIDLVVLYENWNEWVGVGKWYFWGRVRSNRCVKEDVYYEIY